MSESLPEGVLPLLPYPQGAHTGRVLIAAPAGVMECLWTPPVGEAKGMALVCHPHPLYGGALSNKVTYALANQLAKRGYWALRFNFRGVGASTGSHGHAIDETNDTVWLAAQMRAVFPPHTPLVLAGFSFGGFVVLNAARRIAPAALLQVAPPAGSYLGVDAPAPHPQCPWAILHSRDDEVVPMAQTEAALSGYQPPPIWLEVAGAGHFFHGRLEEIQRLMACVPV